jgi:hypothetical protein
VVAYVHPIPGSKVDYYVGVNGEGLGNLQADSLLTVLEQKGRPKGPIVAITIGAGGPQNASARTVLHSGGVKISRGYEIEPSASAAETFSSAKRDMGRAIGALGANGFFAVFAPDDNWGRGELGGSEADTRRRAVHLGLRSELAGEVFRGKAGGEAGSGKDGSGFLDHGKRGRRARDFAAANHCERPKPDEHSDPLRIHQAQAALRRSLRQVLHRSEPADPPAPLS